jgi:hypothetical protein
MELTTRDITGLSVLLHSLGLTKTIATNNAFHAINSRRETQSNIAFASSNELEKSAWDFLRGSNPQLNGQSTTQSESKQSTERNAGN